MPLSISRVSALLRRRPKSEEVPIDSDVCAPSVVKVPAAGVVEPIALGDAQFTKELGKIPVLKAGAAVEPVALPNQESAATVAAPVPPLAILTGVDKLIVGLVVRLPPPVSPVPAVTANELKPGAAEELNVLQKMVLAFALSSVKLKAGVVVGLLTEVVNNGERVPALKLVTVPPDAAMVIVPAPGVIVIPVPWVRVARLKPLPLPIRSSPLVGVLDKPVPPFAMASVFEPKLADAMLP